MGRKAKKVRIDKKYKKWDLAIKHFYVNLVIINMTNENRQTYN